MPLITIWTLQYHYCNNCVEGRNFFLQYFTWQAIMCLPGGSPVLRPGAHWDAGGRKAGQSGAGRHSKGNTAWHSVSVHHSSLAVVLIWQCSVILFWKQKNSFTARIVDNLIRNELHQLFQQTKHNSHFKRQ